MKISGIENVIKGPWSSGPNQKNRSDHYLVWIILGLIVIGCLMVMIAGAVESYHLKIDCFHFFKRHLFSLFLGLVVFFIGRYINFTRLSPSWLGAIFLSGTIISIGLLMLVLVMPASPDGPHRDLRVWGDISFQPAEVAKFFLIFYLANYLARRYGKLGLKNLVVPTAITIIILILIKKQPSLSTNVIIGITFLFLIWLAGANFKYILGYSGIGSLFLIHEIRNELYRVKRVFEFLPDNWIINWFAKKIFGSLPDNFLEETAYHTKQSVMAIGSGGLYGNILNGGFQKFYVPEIHTDFIFSAIGNVLGFIGTLLVISLFFLLVLQGFKIAVRSKNQYLALLGSGISFVIGFQAFYNIIINVGLLPGTGITLPLLSFGGTSLCITLFALGILSSISSCDPRIQQAGQEKIKLEDCLRP
ncbi:MAG: FtsW/RodA/SpoVE family cell cycle protein [Candidatus Eremiobacteraeota bacterium]|nr:FtsW/RodA/SpoVE family cell cycle protein [Candidatus Eremiobacteraeota bacterium]